MYTAQWTKGSRFFRMAAISSATSWRFPSAVTAAFMLLVLLRAMRFLFSALWRMPFSSAAVTCRV